MSRKMPLKKRLIDGHVFQPDDTLLFLYLDDPVHEQERVSVRENLHDVFDRERRLLLFHLFLLSALHKFSNQRHGSAMTRLESHDSRADAGAGERQISNTIHRLVADKIVTPAKTSAQHIALVQHHSVLERSTLDQSLLAQRVDLMNEAKCPRSR